MSLRVNVAELRRRVGERRPVSAEVVLVDAAVGPTRVDDDTPVAVEIELESVSGGVSATGSLRGRWVGECRRCLDPVAGPLEIELDEVFEERPTEGETYPIESDVIDLAPMVRESAMLALTVGPLCREDCPGPSPEQFPVTVAEDEPAPALDPRWAALDQLRDSDEGDPLR